jgi:hypothetical protein
LAEIIDHHPQLYCCTIKKKSLILFREDLLKIYDAPLALWVKGSDFNC